MNTNTPQPIAQTATTHRPFCTWGLAVFCVLTVSTSAAAQTRQSCRRVTPEQTFETVWVVDRSMPELTLWQTLVHVTSSDGFQPIVIHGSEDERWRESLAHLLAIVPQGDSVWVSEAGTRLDIDFWARPYDVANDDPSTGPVVYSADARLDDVAALIAMRLDGVLSAEPPTTNAAAVLVGVDAPQIEKSLDVYLPTRTDALAYANQLAERPVVMIAAEGGLVPEYILWAYQRDAKILEVAVPPYSIYDADTEVTAVESVRDQIRGDLPWLLDGEIPEALVIAGDWYQIPFRFSRGNPNPCSGCDNGVFEYSADSEYANLDDDSWGEPDVPVGRLMSPERDLLAIQSVVGIWREHGAFATATDGVVLDLLGPRGDLRDEMAARWRDTFRQQLWTTMGPDPYDPNFHLDRDAFFSLTDRSDVVVIYGHGHPDFLSPNGSQFNKSISGRHLVNRESVGRPAFWFVHACSTGKPDMDDGITDQTLLVGLQSRLSFGSLMAVEVLGAGSGDPSWWTTALAPDLTVGELVRRYAAASISIYRDGGEPPKGMAQPTGNPEKDRLNAFAVLSWIGDPLTPLEIDR